MTTQEIQTQFIVEVPSDLRDFVKAHHRDFQAAMCTGLSVLMGLPYGTPVRLLANYTDRFQLIEVSGKFEREPDPLELQGLFVGVQASLLAIHSSSASVIDLNGGRVTDA